MSVDHYRTLGVAPGAHPAEVRAAYLQLMRRHHPDARPRDDTSARVARDVNRAYHVLGDAQRRAVYDRRTVHRRSAERAARSIDRAGRVVHPPPACSREQVSYRRSMTRALLRRGAALFALAVVLLVGFG